MKTKLQKLFSSLLILSVFVLTTSATIAQTLTPATPIPASSEVGTSVPLSFNYTSTEACKIRVDLWIVNVDENGVLSNTYCCYQAGEASAALPASSTEAGGSVTVAIPGNLTLSSNLEAGKTYAWDYKLLRDSDNGYITGTQVATTLIASTSVIDYISLSNPPSAAAAGETISVTVNYTCPEARLIKFGISKFNSDGGFMSDLVGMGVDNIPGTTTTPVSLSQELIIPADAIASADLPNGEYYKVDTAIFTPGFGTYISGTNTPITITQATAGKNDPDTNTFKVYPNPVANTMFLNKDLEFESICVYDMTGKKVLEFNKTEVVNNSLNVSSLENGIYFLITNNNKRANFIKY